MASKLPLHPPHPERVCWGCSRHCPAELMACGNGTERTPHPLELFGPCWAHQLCQDPDAPREICEQLAAAGPSSECE